MQTSPKSTDSPLALEPAVGTVAKSSATTAFFSTSVTIFLAEMGDKTQGATLLMTAQSHAPWSILLGASTALIATSLMGVLLGRWFSTVVEPATLDRLAALLMLVIAILLLGDVVEL